MEISYKHASLKQASRRQKCLSSKPWISRGILISIRKRRSMFKSHFLLENYVEKSYFRKYSNELINILSLTKELYLANSFNLITSDPKKTWKYFNLSFLQKKQLVVLKNFDRL